MTQPRPTLWKRLFSGALRLLLGLLLLSAFYLAVILLQPADDAARLASQPLLTASPAVQLTHSDDLDTLCSGFPAPVMHCISGSGMTLTAGSACDAAYEGGFGRILTLTYQTGDGHAFTVQTIYPARAVSLISEDGYRLSNASGHRLGGFPSVRMEKTGSIRLHAQGSEALYVLTVTDAELLPLVTRTLQLPAAE